MPTKQCTRFACLLLAALVLIGIRFTPDSSGVNVYSELIPIHPSVSYHKYDVSDYYAIDPQYGTMEDFEDFTLVSRLTVDENPVIMEGTVLTMPPFAVAVLVRGNAAA